MAKKKVKIDRSLIEQVENIYQNEGYSSVDEFIQLAVEKALEQIRQRDPGEDEAVKERLKGLSYIS